MNFFNTLLYQVRDEQFAVSADVIPGSATSSATEAKEKARWANDRLDRLVLVSSAVWQLVRDRMGLTEEELADKIQELDLSDGVLDGKMRRELRRCAACGRVLSKRHQTCMYCGAEKLENGPFDGI